MAAAAVVEEERADDLAAAAVRCGRRAGRGPAGRSVLSSRLVTGEAVAIRAGVQYLVICEVFFSTWLTGCTALPSPAAIAGGAAIERSDAVSSAPWSIRLIFTRLLHFHDRKQFDAALFHDH
ncbi:hypothetical protein [Actinoallomurus acanthiterrae]